MAPPFDIGPGVRDAMRAAGDEARSHEEYTHDAGTGRVLYSQTHGRDALYLWNPRDGVRRLRLEPAAVGADPAPGGGGRVSGDERRAEVTSTPDRAASSPAVDSNPPSAPPMIALAERCWDRDLLIAAGFSTAAEWLREFGVRREVRAVVWHSMEGSLPGAIARWNTGAAGAHFCLLGDGSVVLTCPLEHVAWGAGTHGRPGQDGYGRTPFWRSTNVNPFAIHVELEGFAARGFSEQQVAAAIRVARWLTARYSIPPEHTQDRIPGHHRHSELSSTRSDPGPLFPLQQVLEACR